MRRSETGRAAKRDIFQWSRAGTSDNLHSRFNVQQAVEKLPFTLREPQGERGAVETIEYFPFVLSFVEALLSFSTACQG